jgi:hypothetical protein
VLSTTRPSSGGADEGRLGVGAIPARGGSGLDRIRLRNKGTRCGSSGPAESERGGAVGVGFRWKMWGGALVLLVAGRRTGKEIAEGWSSVWSYKAGTTPLEERRRRGGERSRVWAQDGERHRRTSSVSWRTLSSGGPTWQREERTAGKARAVEGMARRRVDEGSGVAGARGRPAAEGTRARQGKQRSSGTRGGRQRTQTQKAENSVALL